MYADNSVELKRKSELSQESAVAACKVYIPYISNIGQQLDEVVKIFAMEREPRLIKNRGYLPVPQITPQDTKIETTRNKNELMKDREEIATAMLSAVKQCEENYAREWQVRARDKQLRSVRQTDRTDSNYLTLTAPQSEMTTQDQTNQEYTSTQTQFVMFTPLYPTVTIGMNHLKMTHKYKGQLQHKQTSSQPMQLAWQVVTTRGDEMTPQVQPQTQSHTQRQPDQPVAMVYTTTVHQTP